VSIVRRAPVVPESQLDFVPARWVVLALGAGRLLLRGGKLGKLGLAGLAWTFLPRKLKLWAVGLALAATVVVVGSLAAIALLVMQIAS
jgi:hypothetical protein